MIIENEQLTKEEVIKYIENREKEYEAYGEDIYEFEYYEKEVLYFEGLADGYGHLLHVVQKKTIYDYLIRNNLKTILERIML